MAPGWKRCFTSPSPVTTGVAGSVPPLHQGVCGSRCGDVNVLHCCALWALWLCCVYNEGLSVRLRTFTPAAATGIQAVMVWRQCSTLHCVNTRNFKRLLPHRWVSRQELEFASALCRYFILKHLGERDQQKSGSVKHGEVSGSGTQWRIRKCVFIQQKPTEILSVWWGEADDHEGHTAQSHDL